MDPLAELHKEDRKKVISGLKNGSIKVLEQVGDLEGWTGEEIEEMVDAARVNTSVEIMDMYVWCLKFSPLEALKPYEVLLENSSNVWCLKLCLSEDTYDTYEDGDEQEIVRRLLSAATRNENSKISKFELYLWNDAVVGWRDYAWLERFLPSLPVLKTLVLQVSLYTEREALALYQTLLQMKRLEVFKLELEGDEAPGAVFLLPNLGNVSTLKHVTAICYVGEEVSRAFAIMPCTCPQLESLEFHGQETTMPFPTVPENSRLEKLTVEGATLVPQAEFCRNWTVKELGISGCEFEGDQMRGTFDSFEALKKLTWSGGTLPGAMFPLPSSLEEIHIASCRGMGEQLLASIQGLPNLKKLHITEHYQGYHLPSNPVFSHAQSWGFLAGMQTLECLELTFNNANMTQIVTMAPRELLIQINWRITDDSISGLLAALRASKVKALSILTRVYPHHDNESFPLLQSELALSVASGYYPLEKFAIRDSHPNQGLADFFSVLSGNDVLQDLHIRAKITDRETAEVVVATLKVNETLTRLEGITFDEGLSDLERMAKHFMSLNRHGRRLLRAPEASVPLALWQLILQRIANDGNLSVLFVFLKKKPDLFRLISGERKRRAEDDSSAQNEDERV